ncbi:MAG: hypothetical protein CEO22_655, partial [Candidatus Berkelbacteria bacterium Gr01-1014_85]
LGLQAEQVRKQALVIQLIRFEMVSAHRIQATPGITG